MKADEFSKPLSARACPDGVAAAVWQAFVAAEAARTPAERKDKWLAYLAVHRLYYDEQGKLKPAQQLITF